MTAKKKAPSSAETVTSTSDQSTQTTQDSAPSTSPTVNQINGVGLENLKEMIMQQNPMGQWYNNLFQGQLSPMTRPRQRSKPVYDKPYTINSTNGKNFTICKVYIHSPTLQFPTTGIFIQLANSKGSCYCRFETPDDFQSFASHLLSLCEDISKTYNQLKEQEVIINSQLNQTASLLQAFKNNDNDGNNYFAED